MKIFNRSKRIINSAVVSGATLALVAAPVATFAQGGGHGDRSDGRGGNDSRRGNTSVRTSDSRQRNSDWSNRKQDKSAATATYLANMKQKNKQTCSERQTWLNQQAADAKDRSMKKLTGLNIMLNGVQTYATSGDVTVPNYDALNGAAVGSQATATTAVDAIAAPQLNCDDEAVATDEAQGKSRGMHDKYMNDTISAAKQALKDYRQDVRALFDAAINS